MQPYIDEMLGLTADIAEELLCLKDTGGRVSDLLAEKINRLATLAIEDAALIDTVSGSNDYESGSDVSDEREDTDSCICDAEPDSVTKNDGVADDVAEVESGESPAEEIYDNPESEYNPEPTDGLPEMQELPNKEVVGNSVALKRAFSLNDMFLYRRLLFNGSSQDFNDVLEIVPSLQSPDEVCRLLSDRYDVDLQSDEAKTFIEILISYINLSN